MNKTIRNVQWLTQRNIQSTRMPFNGIGDIYGETRKPFAKLNKRTI